jgi:Tfp pilus assembly protein PilF
MFTVRAGGPRLARAGLLLAAACLAACPASRGGVSDTRERAYRANNVGVARLEQLQYPEAATAFRNALASDPTLAIVHFNLALALLYQQDLDGAAREAADAAARMPDRPQPPYVLGLIARARNHNDAARGYFEQVRRIDPSDVGASVNLAQVDLEDRRYDEAVSVLRPIVSAEPYHITAAYVLGLALTRSGADDEGQRLLERAQALRRASYAVTFGTGYLEQGRYAEAIASTGAEPELVDPRTPAASFSASSIGPSQTAAAAVASSFGRTFTPAQLTDAVVREIAAGLGGGAVLVDVDGDGDLDLVVVSAAGQRLLRHDARDQWVDATVGSGLDSVPTDDVPVGVVSADFDNDGAADLFVLRAGQSVLYRNDGRGHFTDVTRSAGIPPFPALPGSAAFVDVDHDGDVDLVIAGLADIAGTKAQSAASVVFPSGFATAPLQLLRNNGNGTFTDITRDARLESRGHAIAVVPTDYDNHRDIDLLVVNADGPPLLFANQRDGTFRDVAGETGLSRVAAAGETVSAVAAGDVNKDDWPDFVFARPSGSLIAMSDGRGRFTVSALPASIGSPSAVQLVDYDNDGLLDVLASGAEGPRLLRNVGRAWVDVTSAAFGRLAAPTATTGLRALAAADVDADGDTDIVAAAGGVATLWRNSGEARNRSLRVQLRGRVTNRLGIGSKVQVRAGSLNGRFETSAAWPPVAPSDIVFGVGPRPGAEVVRILWPSGILQAETGPASGPGGETIPVLPSPFAVEELDRKPSSCPFLFVWNGERFEFVTDFLGGGEIGDWEGPGKYDRPDPVEYVRIGGDQLKPAGERLSIRITNELEEVLYLDRVQLLALTHPADVQVFPNEGMTNPPKPFRLHVVRGARALARVTDEHGHDVTERVAKLDRRYPDDFAVSRIRGYADMHTLTFDIGQARGGSTLLLTGWTDYAFSSDTLAALQAGRASIEPALEVHQADGRWRRLPVNVGIPVGRPQTIALDLTGVLRPGEHELRLTTNMRIYWDQILVGDMAAPDSVRVKTLEPVSATLKARGFSAEVRPDGHEPPVYDYTRVSVASPWKLLTGSYTREGDVLGLLTGSDDRFAIAKPGDEIALEFPAAGLPQLPDGWTRTFLLKGDGFSKEMDPNSASPYSVEPLPFHAMTSYPYPANEHYPETPEYDRYRTDFNTRTVTRPLAPLYTQ